MLVSAVVSAVLQVAVVLVLGGLVYFPLRGKAKPSFVEFLGLGRTTELAVLAGVVLGAIGAVACLAIPGVAAAGRAPHSVVGDMVAAGLSGETVAALVVSAAIKTALAEELLFRGLLAKRLYAWIGFWPGNVVQALIFGGIHVGLMALLHGSAVVMAAFGLFAGLMALVAGWLNEKPGKGSIWSGWALHGTSNVVSYLCLAFGVFH